MTNYMCIYIYISNSPHVPHESSHFLHDLPVAQALALEIQLLHQGMLRQALALHLRLQAHAWGKTTADVDFIRSYIHNQCNTYIYIYIYVCVYIYIHYVYIYINRIRVIA